MTAAFMRTSDVAEFFGISETTFYQKRPALEAEGFPPPDPVLKRYLREDVEAWIRGRRRVPDPDTVQIEGGAGIDFSAL